LQTSVYKIDIVPEDPDCEWLQHDPGVAFYAQKLWI
jgi:hypothetical protein